MHTPMIGRPEARSSVGVTITTGRVFVLPWPSGTFARTICPNRKGPKASLRFVEPILVRGFEGREPFKRGPAQGGRFDPPEGREFIGVVLRRVAFVPGLDD